MDQKLQCERCQALWEELAAATRKYFKVQSKFDIARLRYDPEAAQILARELEAAAEKRAAVFRIMDEHRTGHAEAAKAIV